MNTQKVQNVQQKECNVGFLKRNTTSLQGYGHKILTPTVVFHPLIAWGFPRNHPVLVSHFNFCSSFFL